MNLLDQIIFNTSPGPKFDHDAASDALVAQKLVRLIAFYLPQFHAIPENDAWWGEGFTEWTNVTKAVPRYVGHHQPRLPGALGFYDATNPDVLRRQAALAKKYGVYGFCFHHYWFNGRRVLERPLETLLENPDIDLPFCINWANENWTRRWDGKNQDVLLHQEYSPDDDIAFAKSLEPLVRDPRYIKINGRPLVLLYRPDLLPDASKTVERWREQFETSGLGNPLVVMVQTLGSGEHEKYGMDAAAGFPPFWKAYNTPMRGDLRLIDPKFSGFVRDYATLANATIEGYRNDKRVFPGVTPSWDNEARAPGRGVSFSGSSPAAYGNWLREACYASMREFVGEERLVFINAWNEWAEGAYLEPDRHFGYAYLAETARVLSNLDANPAQPHDNSALKMDRPSFMAKLKNRVLNLGARGADKTAAMLRGL